MNVRPLDKLSGKENLIIRVRAKRQTHPLLDLASCVGTRSLACGMWPFFYWGRELRSRASCAALTFSTQRTRPTPTQHEPKRRDWRLLTKRSASYARTAKQVQVLELKFRSDRCYYV